jgi:hypothetical protein
MSFKETEDADARGRIAALEEESNRHSHVIAILQDKVTQLSTDFGRLLGEVSPLRSASAGNSDTFRRSFCSEHTNCIKAEQFPAGSFLSHNSFLSVFFFFFENRMF